MTDETTPLTDEDLDASSGREDMARRVVAEIRRLRALPRPKAGRQGVRKEAPKRSVSAASIRRLPLTKVTSALALLVTIAALLMDTNVELNLGPVKRIEGTEIVQVAASWLLVFVAVRGTESWPLGRRPSRTAR